MLTRLLSEGRADMAGIGRGFLNDPRWAWHAATALGATVDVPRQYQRVLPRSWPGYARVRPEDAALQDMAAD